MKTTDLSEITKQKEKDSLTHLEDKDDERKSSKNQLVRPLRDILLAFHHSSPRPVHFPGYREGELNRAVY